jgi:hypothetical protein
MSDQQPDTNAAFTVDLSGGGAPETGGQAARRVGLGVLLVVLGLVIAAGSLALFIAAFLIPVLFDWIDLIWDFWWVLGGAGLVLVVVGFAMARHSRRSGKGVAETAYDDLVRTGLIDDDPAPESAQPHPPMRPDTRTIT